MTRQLNVFDGIESFDDYNYEIRKAGVKLATGNQVEEVLRQVAEEQNEFRQVFTLLKNIRDIKERKFGSPVSVEEFLRFIKDFEIPQQWKPEARALFESSCDVIINWRDFFFSYSTKNRKFIDAQYESIINEFFTKFDVNENNSIDNTLKIAYIIHHHLKEENLLPFHDLSDLHNGEVILDRLAEGCEKCFTFVQLLHQFSFKKPPEKDKNWSYEEFILYKECNTLPALLGKPADECKRYHFIFLQKDLPSLLPADLGVFEGWWNEIRERNNLSISHVRNIRELILAIKESGIPQSIKEKRDATLNELTRYKEF